MAAGNAMPGANGLCSAWVQLPKSLPAHARRKPVHSARESHSAAFAEECGETNSSERFEEIADDAKQLQTMRRNCRRCEAITDDAKQLETMRSNWRRCEAIGDDAKQLQTNEGRRMRLHTLPIVRLNSSVQIRLPKFVCLHSSA